MGEILQILVTGIFSLSVALGSVWLKHYLDVKKKAKVDAQHEHITDSDINSMIDIQKHLENFREKWKFCRIGIYQFHNGGKFFNGIPMKKYSQSFESIDSGISKVKKHNQNILVSEHPNFIQQLGKSDFFIIESNDSLLNYNGSNLEEQGILQLFNAPIRTLSGQLIGFLQLHTVKDRIELSEELTEEVGELVNNLSGYLLTK